MTPTQWEKGSLQASYRARPTSLTASSFSAARWAASSAVVTWAIVPRRKANETSLLMFLLLALPLARVCHAVGTLSSKSCAMSLTKTPIK